MARVLVTLRPQAGEREVVEGVLAGDVAWLEDAVAAGPDAVAAAVHQAEVALCFWPREELRRADLSWRDLPALRLIQVATAGVNHIGWRDVPPSVPVANAPGSSADAVAEYILAAVLQWARGFSRSTAAIRAGQWPLGAPVRALSELRVGLVGYGGIGRAAARLLADRGAVVRAVNRSGGAPGDALRHVEQLDTMAGLADLAQWSDALVVCLPLVRETLGLVDAHVLARMTDRDALVVNVARGPVVVQDALFAWLAQDRARRSAVMDVWWRYPKQAGERPYDRPFHELANVIMTPHNAPNVTGFRLAMIQQAAKQVRRFLDTGHAVHVQDREAHLLDVEGDGR